MSAYRYEPGSQPIEGYTIQYALGRGGFGEVYFAISDAGREVALKAVQNFEDIELRGIRHCMNLKSLHLVMIFDVKIATDGTPWVIMEYVAGPSLREILDDSPGGLKPDQAMFLLRELAKGLSDLHSAGIVHRDLKPQNVFFENGTVKIGDYSLSKAMTASHRSGHTMTVGSVHYMAPEISQGRYDKTVDIYALGVILYEMLTGEPPFVGESIGEVLMKHLDSSADVSEIEEPFATVISKAMQRDPNERFQTTHEMAASLGGDQNIADTISPATLSMIGTRSREQRRQQAKEGCSLADTFTSPAALKDTHSQHDPSPLQWLERFFVIEGNMFWRAAAIALAFVCSAGLLAIGALSGWTQLRGMDCVEVAVRLVIAVVIGRWLFRAIPILRSDWKHAGRWYASVARRISTLAFLGFVWFVHFHTLSGRAMDDLESIFSGLAWSMVLIDWILLISPNRPKFISLLPTIAVGVIAAIVSYIAVGDSDWMAFDAALVMSAALSIQIVSPRIRLTKRPSTGSPPAEDVKFDSTVFVQTKEEVSA